MKQTTLLVILTMIISVLAACQNPGNGNAGTKTTTANKPVSATNTAGDRTTANTETAAAPKKEMASVELGDIDPGSAMPASSLNEKFSLMPDDWKGQKVAVTGLYKSHSTSEGVNAKSAYRTDLKDKDTKTAVGCFSKERPALWDDVQKNYQKYEKEKIVVRGVVAGTVDYGDGPFVGLEPCEIVTK